MWLFGGMVISVFKEIKGGLENMEIRKASRSDAHILSALNVDVQKIHADALPQIFKQPNSDSFAVQFMLDRLSDPLNVFFIANLQDEDIGYLYARIVDRPENPFMYAWKYLYIDQVSIKPTQQGKGYGQLLLEAVRHLAKDHGIDTIVIDTWSFNTGAHSFFQKNGYSTFNFRMWQMNSHTLIPGRVL